MDGLKSTLKAFPVLLIIPSLVILSIFLFYPLVRTIVMSFYSLPLLDPASYGSFVGLGNYVKLVQDGGFWEAFLRTVYYTVAGVVGAYVMGLITALVLASKMGSRGLIRVLIISPWAVPYVVAAFTGRFMFDYQYGAINLMLKYVHLIPENIGWLMDADLALLCLIVVTIWKEFPFATLMLLAGIQSISQDFYDAAKVDGAGILQQFYYVTWPQLRNITNVALILLTIRIFKLFTLAFVMTGGGPGDATELLILKTYFESFRKFNFGYASAMGTIMLVIVMMFSVIYFSLQREELE